MHEWSDLHREYAERDHILAGSDVYALTNPSHLFAVQSRQRVTISLLYQFGLTAISNLKILELGCGKGDVLRGYLQLGANTSNLHGTDLIFRRIREAKNSIPCLHLTCSDGQTLPYPHNTFDIVMQYTVMSSILSQEIRDGVAEEMLRVLSPGGVILWYDFWLNPTNRHAAGIGKRAIRDLFPRCVFSFRRITLAPPIARRLVPLSWTVSLLLEKARLFNSHYLVAIRPI